MITKEFLKSVPLFAGLSDEDAVALAGLGREETFRKGDVIFREGTSNDGLYAVLSGVVEVTRSAAGRPTRLERGEVFGELSLFDRAPRPATAAAAVVPETRLAVWDGAAFRKFLTSRPAAGAMLLEAFLKVMSARLRETSDAVCALLRTMESRQ